MYIRRRFSSFPLLARVCILRASVALQLIAAGRLPLLVPICASVCAALAFGARRERWHVRCTAAFPPAAIKSRVIIFAQTIIRYYHVLLLLVLQHPHPPPPAKSNLRRVCKLRLVANCKFFRRLGLPQCFDFVCPCCVFALTDDFNASFFYCCSMARMNSDKTHLVTHHPKHLRASMAIPTLLVRIFCKII